VSLTLTSPAALWLLLAIPLVWLALPFARTRFNRRQRLLQATIRSLLLAALAFAIARPVLSSSSSQQSVVYLVDISHSVARSAIDEATEHIDEINGSLRPAHSRIVAFARTAVPIADTTALRELARLEPGIGSLDRSGTDLEAALLSARGELAPGHLPHIVLFTDGQATAGDELDAVARLSADRIPVSTAPLAPPSLNDTWVESLEVPEQVGAGEPFAVTVRIASQRATPAKVELRVGGGMVAARPVDLLPGITPVTLEARAAAPGPHQIEAAIDVPGDPLIANNILGAETWADPPARVLYLESAPASAKYLAGALTAAGFEVTVQPPTGLPPTAEAFDEWDVVILSDVERAAISDEAMAALTEWVERRGGGLLMAGGERVFGDDGYRHTALERLMPVTFERRDEPEVALVIVLDRSWSMAGASMELTKTAALAALDVLGDQQLIGILTFNDKFDWDVPIRNVGEHRDAIRQKIEAIAPGGHTLIYPAVEQAYLALRTARARARHVILLSDGRSYPAEYEELVKRMVEAQITLSTVAVGPSADPDLLRDLAQWGKGRAYVVADATSVPEIFVKEARDAATPAFDERAISPVVRAQGFLSGVDLARMPPLKGRTAAVLKDDALELVATDEDDPLLAFWPVGLGRTAIFASDVKDRWGAEWVTWQGYGPFFASVARALQRQRTPPFSLAVSEGPIRGHARSISIHVEARDADGGYRNLAPPVVEVHPRGGQPVTLPTRQVAPGRYDAVVVVGAGQAVTVRMVAPEPAGAGVTSRTILVDPAAEYRFRAPDHDHLQSIASAGGGVWRPTAEDLKRTTSGSRSRRRPLWPGLLTLGLLLWFADLGLRRVRVFEPRISE
jgi:Ca-activated chloride channel homolog